MKLKYDEEKPCVSRLVRATLVLHQTPLNTAKQSEMVPLKLKKRIVCVACLAMICVDIVTIITSFSEEGTRSVFSGVEVSFNTFLLHTRPDSQRKVTFDKSLEDEKIIIKIQLTVHM